MATRVLFRSLRGSLRSFASAAPPASATPGRAFLKANPYSNAFPAPDEREFYPITTVLPFVLGVSVLAGVVNYAVAEAKIMGGTLGGKGVLIARS